MDLATLGITALDITSIALPLYVLLGQALRPLVISYYIATVTLYTDKLIFRALITMFQMTVSLMNSYLMSCFMGTIRSRMVSILVFFTMPLDVLTAPSVYFFNCIDGFPHVHLDPGILIIFFDSFNLTENLFFSFFI